MMSVRSKRPPQMRRQSVDENFKMLLRRKCMMLLFEERTESNEKSKGKNVKKKNYYYEILVKLVMVNKNISILYEKNVCYNH